MVDTRMKCQAFSKYLLVKPLPTDLGNIRDRKIYQAE